MTDSVFSSAATEPFEHDIWHFWFRNMNAFEMNNRTYFRELKGRNIVTMRKFELKLKKIQYNYPSVRD
jgi:hypothetical protein